MRILLDECLPARLKRAFPGHAVQTVTQAGWRSTKDGPLLKFAQGRFDVFITVDGKLEHENDLSRYNLAFIIVRVPNNRLESFQPIFERLNASAEAVRAGEVIHVASRGLHS